MRSEAQSPGEANGGSRGRRTLVLIALAVAAPVVLSYAFYYLFPRGSHANYGELLPAGPVHPVPAVNADGRALRLDELRGHWTIVMSATGTCNAGCERALYATRQARTMQGKAMDRVQRLWLVTGTSMPEARLLNEHPDLVVARANAGDLAALPRGSEPIYLIDPLGNQVLAWPRDPDIKAMAGDLARLLKASRIG